jgi:cytochrome c
MAIDHARASGILIVVVSATLAAAQSPSGLERHGQSLLAANCARCHSIGRSGTSPHPSAPPFRILGKRYPIDNLAEGLAEGLVSGHPDMPEFVFPPEDISAILAYLKSVQEP